MECRSVPGLVPTGWHLPDLWASLRRRLRYRGEEQAARPDVPCGRLSGGQFVLVNEAVNLGIAINNMRQGDGIRHETLFRDETVGTLDTKNGREYVRMLRRAMDVVGYDQVIFVCHAPQIWEMADRVLRVEGGKVFIDAGRGEYARIE
ncbi:MAG TPA: hypothetical protein VMT20_10675 [Terriglobia bacterium]|nr:hypothetical protein [Terriglobia bacterium]